MATPLTATWVFSLARVTADELRWAEEPWRLHPCHRASSIGPLELAALAEVMGIGDRREVTREFSLLAGESQESPWVVSVPEGLMSRIGALGEGEARDIAEDWAAACEPEADSTATMLLEYLEGLAAFARHSSGPYALYVQLGAT